MSASVVILTDEHLAAMTRIGDRLDEVCTLLRESEPKQQRPLDDLVTFREAAERLKTSIRTLERHVLAGDFRQYGKGRSRRVDMREVLNALRKQGEGTL